MLDEFEQEAVKDRLEGVREELNEILKGRKKKELAPEELKQYRKIVERDYYSRKPEKLAEWRKKSYKNLTESPAAMLYYAARGRARQEGIDFNISIKDIEDVLVDVCPVLGLPLKRQEKRASANSPSLDRLINEKGYTKGNIRVISYKANSHKSNMTVDQAEKLLLYMKGEL